MTELPELDSDLIELALADLAKCADDPAYEVNMLVWHEPIDGRCAVCLAGAVLAKTVGIKPTKIVGPNLRIRARDGSRLERLDDYRRGKDPDDELAPPDVTPWEEDPEAFVEDMKKVADVLRGAGR